MTLLQEIANLTWWNEPNKIKSILTKLNTLFIGITNRVTALEDAPIGGGDFIPLSGTEVGSPFTGEILEFSSAGEQTIVRNTPDGDTTTSLIFYDTGLNIFTANLETGIQTQVEIGSGEGGEIVYLGYTDDTLVEGRYVTLNENGIIISDTNPTAKGLTGTQNYTANITDLDFIQKIYADSLLPQVADNYADDTAAAVGGIAIGQLYHTAGTTKVRLT